MSKEEIIKDLEDHAKKHGFIVNPNKNIVDFLVEGIAENEKNLGKRYCACRAFKGKNEKDSICPCIWHEDEINKKGSCHCGLFLRKINKD